MLNKTKTPSYGLVSCYVSIPDEEFCYEVRLTQREYGLMKDHFTWELDDEQDTIIYLKKEQAKFKIVKSYKQVATCAYEATNDYFQSMLGMKLTIADKDWYSNHPCVVTNGLPSADALTVLASLVFPYGIGISKVYHKKKMSLSEDMRKWVEILGINPKGLADRDCSNEEYIQLASGGNQEVAKALQQQAAGWKFEFTDEIKGPAVVLASTSHLPNSQSYAPGGGHATFCSPRGKPAENWTLAVKYARLEDITYQKPLPEGLDVDFEQKYTKTISFDDCLTDKGVEFREVWKSAPYESSQSFRSSTPNTYPTGSDRRSLPVSSLDRGVKDFFPKPEDIPLFDPVEYEKDRHELKLAAYDELDVAEKVIDPNIVALLVDSLNSFAFNQKVITVYNRIPYLQEMAMSSDCLLRKIRDEGCQTEYDNIASILKREARTTTALEAYIVFKTLIKKQSRLAQAVAKFSLAKLTPVLTLETSTS